MLQFFHDFLYNKATFIATCAVVGVVGAFCFIVVGVLLYPVRECDPYEE